MGRVRDLGSLDDCVAIAARLDWVRPVIDFAHMHATSDGAFLETGMFADALAKADAVIEPGAPFHIHFSDIAYANRNETKHLPYGEGTLRVAPLGKALARFPRRATVISEAPGEESHQAIRAELFSAAGKSSARRSSRRSASSSRPRSRRN
jgi:deoxyribonuclease-4